MLNQTRKHHRAFQASPWIILAGAAILLCIVVVMGFQNYKSEKKYVSRILTEKGMALIRSVEAGTRTGIMRKRLWKKEQIQTLFEETAQTPGVLEIALVTPKHRIIAHSSPEQVGKIIPQLPEGPPGKWPKWFFDQTPSGQKAFVIYKAFTPMIRKHHGKQRIIRDQKDEICRPDDCPMQQALNMPPKNLFIIATLDPAPFETIASDGVINSFFLSGALLLLGLGGLVSLFWMQNYQAAQKSLEDTSAFANAAVKSLPVGLVATDRDNRISIYNETAQRISGLDLSAARGLNAAGIFPDTINQFMSEAKGVRGAREQEVNCEFRPGRMVPVSMGISPIINEAGETIGKVLILRDLTDVRALQDAVKKQEKLAAIGGLAAGVAHEIRNPLSSIKGMASFFKNKFNTNDDDKAAADVMIQETDRLNRAVTDLLEFSTPAQVQMEMQPLAPVISHALTMIKSDAKALNVLINTQLTQNPVLHIDTDRITQCLLNLLLNAMEALPSGGVISVTDHIDDAWSCVSISDTGPGIPEDKIKHIFDPYFTTKAKGTGLGLAIVNKIIEAHNGQIDVKNHQEGGAVFTLKLPLPPEKI